MYSNPPNPGHWRLRALLLALALLLAPLLGLAPTPALAAPSCTTSGTTVTCTFSYTGAPETWIVPAGVTQATFDLYGAQGGGSFSGVKGGKGGRVVATLAVTPGATYQVLVGGQKGFNGGGAGSGESFVQGYNGGGASDVRAAPYELDDRLLVTGGGGGAGREGGAGGAGGYPNGGSGASGFGDAGGDGGGGGTQSGGGGGAYGAQAGSLGQGGNGAAGVVGDRDGFGGGGGGGGYYGGGGGGRGNEDFDGGGGGGGGGSSYGPAGATFENGVRAGDGLVILSYTQPDTSAPVASPSQLPAANSAGWNSSDVTVSWNWADDAGGSGLDLAHCTSSSTSSGQGALTLSASCADLAGNQGSASYTVKVDATAPTISAAATSSPNANGWYKGDVTVHFSCADALSGIPSGACPADQTLSGEGTSISSSAQSVSDVAGNTSAPSNIVTVQIDRNAPSVSVTGVTNGAVYTLGGVPTAACSTMDALSGVATAATLSLSGSGVGVITATCTGATDVAGNSAPALSVSYSVAYAFSGFLDPVDNPPIVNVAKAGSAISLKWRLTDASGNPITTLANVTVTSAAGGCSASTPTDDVEAYATGASGLQNLGNGYYQYNWQTQKSWAGSCRTLKLDLGDGQPRTALFQFR